MWPVGWKRADYEMDRFCLVSFRCRWRMMASTKEAERQTNENRRESLSVSPRYRHQPRHLTMGNRWNVQTSTALWLAPNDSTNTRSRIYFHCGHFNQLELENIVNFIWKFQMNWNIIFVLKLFCFGKRNNGNRLFRSISATNHLFIWWVGDKSLMDTF